MAKVYVGVRLPQDMVDFIDTMAQKKRLTRTQAIEQLLDVAIQRKNSSQQVSNHLDKLHNNLAELLEQDKQINAAINSIAIEQKQLLKLCRRRNRSRYWDDLHND